MAHTRFLKFRCKCVGAVRSHQHVSGPDDMHRLRITEGGGWYTTTPQNSGYVAWLSAFDPTTSARWFVRVWESHARGVSAMRMGVSRPRVPRVPISWDCADVEYHAHVTSMGHISGATERDSLSKTERSGTRALLRAPYAPLLQRRGLNDTLHQVGKTVNNDMRYVKTAHIHAQLPFPCLRMIALIPEGKRSPPILPPPS